MITQSSVKTIVEALPNDVVVTTIVRSHIVDDDPLIASCLPHPAVVACIHGNEDPVILREAQAWMDSRPDVQRRAAVLTDRLLVDLAECGNGALPGWVGTHWSAVVRCPWANGLDDAVAAGEAFFARS